MENKKSLQAIKHLFRSPNCINCSYRLDDFIFDIKEGKILCPICSFKHNPVELYSDGEIINLATTLIPDDHEYFLTKLGFDKKPIRRTPKSGVIFLSIIMVLGAIMAVALLDINIVLKLILIPVAVALTIWQILKDYKDEEKPKWYRKKITSKSRGTF